MIQVLIVEDCKVTSQFLAGLLAAERDIQVVGRLENGLEAVAYVDQHPAPNVIIMDIHMPRMDGFAATRRIMETKPIPIVVVSTLITPSTPKMYLQAMEAGAVAAIEMPRGGQTGQHDGSQAKFLRTIRLMSEVKVIRRRPPVNLAQATPQAAAAKPLPHRPAALGTDLPVIAVGASTGGPPVLQTILSLLPKNFPAAMLIVQHITPGFLPGMIDWLKETTHVEVRIGEHGIELQAGVVYFAPDANHMGIDASRRIILSQDSPIHGIRPSATHLFRSVADALGKKAIGILLTGMGVDGAAELKRMKDLGALTLVQNRESSIVFGMPGEAVRLGAATHVLAPEEIGGMLMGLSS